MKKPTTVSFFDCHGYRITLRRAAIVAFKYNADKDRLVISTATEDYAPDTADIAGVDDFERDIFEDNEE